MQTRIKIKKKTGKTIDDEHEREHEVEDDDAAKESMKIKLQKEDKGRLNILALMKKAVMVRAQNLKMMWTVE